MKLEMTMAGFTDTGLVRGINQDAIFYEESDGIYVFCIADGMGGHLHGEKASREIVQGVKVWLRNFYPGKYHSNFTRIMEDYERCLLEANKKIYRLYNIDGLCGSTLVSMIVFRDRFAIFSFGDSRIYRKRGKKFEQITRDDTWQNMMAVQSGMSARQIQNDSRYGKIVNAMGIQESIVLHRQSDLVKRGDYFILCSDGIYKYCKEEKLKDICKDSLFTKRTFLQKIHDIKDYVYERGASDNMSLILARVDKLKK